LAEEEWVWTEFPSEKAEEMKEIVKCPNCSEIMNIITEPIPLYGGSVVSYCDNYDRFFIRERSGK